MEIFYSGPFKFSKKIGGPKNSPVWFQLDGGSIGRRHSVADNGKCCFIKFARASKVTRGNGNGA